MAASVALPPSRSPGRTRPNPATYYASTTQPPPHQHLHPAHGKRQRPVLHSTQAWSTPNNATKAHARLQWSPHVNIQPLARPSLHAVVLDDLPQDLLRCRHALPRRPRHHEVLGTRVSSGPHRVLRRGGRGGRPRRGTASTVAAVGRHGGMGRRQQQQAAPAVHPHAYPAMTPSPKAAPAHRPVPHPCADCCPPSAPWPADSVSTCASLPILPHLWPPCAPLLPYSPT